MAASYSFQYAPVQQATPQWQQVPGVTDQIALVQDGRHLGSWNLEGQYYLARVGEGWGKKEFIVPVPLPSQYRQDKVAKKSCPCGCDLTGVCTCASCQCTTCKCLLSAKAQGKRPSVSDSDSEESVTKK